MDTLIPPYFFDLGNYAHAKIFDHCQFVWQALARIEAYLEGQDLGQLKIKAPKSAHLINKEMISIGKGTVIEEGAYIKGPCIIGENCQIRQGAYIRGNFICGNNCVIGHGTEIKNSIFLDDAHAAHFAYVGDTILGNHTNLGAGTVCANLKFDKTGIVLTIEGKVITTGLKKLGAIIGDHSQTGCNSVTNPGTVMGQGVLCYPGLNIGGFIPSRCIVRSTEKMIITPYELKAMQG